MTQREFIGRLGQLYAENVATAKRKNTDYAGIGDPFHNIKMCESYGVPAVKGIMVRMSDKMSRIGNLLDREAKVTDETILDALSDLANYAMIMRILIEDRSNNGKK